MGAIPIAIHGAAGRMGRRLIALGASDPALEIVAAVDSPTHPDLGKDAGTLAGINPLNLPLTEHFGEAHPASVIDFSVPAAAETITAVCVKRKIPLVMATTGLSEDQRRQLREHIYLIILIIPLVALTVDLILFWIQRQLFPHVYGGAGWLQRGLRLALYRWDDTKRFFFHYEPVAITSAIQPPAAGVTPPESRQS
jgi:4-hydroxy-tetrahydrodipicolinate reductase